MVTKALNLGSYNYLGATDRDCIAGALEALQVLGPSTCGRAGAWGAGVTPVHQELERTVADFVGKPGALVLGNGFATNALTIPCLAGEGTLVLSDSLNHTSIVSGIRASGAASKVFKHNDLKDL